MAHAIVEYSENIENIINLQDLIDKIHQCCMETGVFPAQGMRTRGVKRELFRVGNVNEEAFFVHIQLKMGPGRKENEKQRAMEEIFSVLELETKNLRKKAPVALSIEVNELPEKLRINNNNLRDFNSIS